MPKVLGEEGDNYLIGTDDGRQLFIPKNAVNDLFPQLPYSQSDFYNGNVGVTPPQNQLLEPKVQQPGLPAQTLNQPSEQVPELNVDDPLQNQSQSVKVSGAERGFNPTKFQQVKEAIPLTGDSKKSLGKLTKAQQREQELAQPLEQVQQQREQAVKQLGEANAKAIEESAVAKQQVADLLGEQAKQEILITDKANAKADEIMNKYDLVSKEVEALEKRGVDRGRWYKSASTAQKVSFGLAAFIDGFLKPKTGGTGGVKILLDLIDKDVDDQVRDIQMGRERLQGIKNHASFVLSQAGSSQALRAQARGILIDSAIRKAEADLTRIQSPIKRAEAESLIGELRKEQAINRQNIRQRVFDETKQSEQLAIQRGHLALGYAQLELQKKEMEARRLAAQQQAVETKTIRNTTTGQDIGVVRDTFKNDSTVIRETQDKVTAYETARELSTRYRAALKRVKAGRSPFQTGRFREQEWADMDGMYNDLLSQLIHARSGTAANVEEVKRLANVIPGPRKMVQRNDPVKTFDEYLKTQDSGIRKRLTGVLETLDKNALPDLLFQSLDASQNVKNTPERTAGQIQGLLTAIRDTPGNTEAVNLLKQHSDELIILAAENPDDIQFILGTARSIPKKLRIDENGNDIVDELKKIQRKQETQSIQKTEADVTYNTAVERDALSPRF